jgi:hypothetical protein
MLGNSRSAQATATRLLRSLPFLQRYGASPKTTRFRFPESDK